LAIAPYTAIFDSAISLSWSFLRYQYAKERPRRGARRPQLF
jgi:hypothetical protein